MRTLVFAALAAVPVALVGWVVWQGMHPPPPEKLVQSLGGHPTAKGPAAQADPDAALLALFDGSPGGVKVKEKVALYDSKGLFDYIDGAAPIFIERGYRRLGAAEMAFEGSDLTCDVYDMVTPENATAIFNKEKPPTAKQVEGWPAAISGPMSFVFHAGRYYVKLTAFDAKAESALPALAKALREKAGTPPIAVVTPQGTAPATKPADEDGALLALFDGPLGGAKVKEKAVLYDSKGLFDYIDGAAPVFIERGYRRLATAELASPEGSDLVCDVYDMATADNAKAIFEKERSPSAKPVEGFPQAISGSMSFVFHAGRYYVKLTAFDAKAEAVLPALAAALKEKMR